VYGRFRYSDLKEASSRAMGFEWGLGGMTLPAPCRRAITVTASLVRRGGAKIRLIFSTVADESEQD